MDTVLFVNATIGFSENLFLVYLFIYLFIYNSKLNQKVHEDGGRAVLRYGLSFTNQCGRYGFKKANN